MFNRIIILSLKLPPHKENENIVYLKSFIEYPTVNFPISEHEEALVGVRKQ